MQKVKENQILNFCIIYDHKDISQEVINIHGVDDVLDSKRMISMDALKAIIVGFSFFDSDM